MTTNDIANALLAAGISAEIRRVGTADVVYAPNGDSSVELSVNQQSVFVEFYRADLPDAEDAPIATFGTIDDATDAVRKWFGKSV
jgi:hypothetical protein